MEWEVEKHKRTSLKLLRIALRANTGVHIDNLIKVLTFFSQGVRLSPRGTAATQWPIVPAPKHR
jgi:hypothetical protein